MSEGDEQQLPSLKVGQDNVLPVRLTDENGDPIKLTDASGLTEIACHLPQPDGAVLELTKTGGAITVVDGEAGRASIRITKENTATLLASKTNPANFEVLVDRTVNAVADRKVARFEKAILILPALL
jgi:hypothetical protein